MTDPADVLPITVVSDVVCPWCFIGKHRLEAAIAMRPDLPVAIEWYPYFLNSWIPQGGISREEYLITKFGSVEAYADIAKRVTAAAAAEGLIYASQKIARQPNTRDCHRLIRWAKEDKGNGGAMKQRLMEMYFTEGADLTDNAVLATAAAACGLDADDIRARLASDRDAATVTEQAESAERSGISGVPCFIFGGVIAVTGAQSAEDLAQAMDNAVIERKRRLAIAATS